MTRFSAQPEIPLLQWLARGSLKQNLPRASRLWVWLRFLYSQDENRLPHSFTYADWRDAFFSTSHPKGEAIPKPHDPHCACVKTMAQWLFHSEIGISETEWRQELQQHDAIPDKTLNDFLQQQLFAVTRRTLLSDLHILKDLGWLHQCGQKYTLVSEFPSLPVKDISEAAGRRRNNYELNFLHPDLEAIAQTHAQKIGGIQRFFLHTDYIIPPNALDHVDDLQDKLKQCWQQKIVPPVQFIYNSAKHGKVECIVYPVCVYYCQRAVYLCALGKNPKGLEDWYNYRFDRIYQMTVLEWNSPAVPLKLQQQCRQGTLPTPDYIEEEMAQAWGFDFYEQSQLILLRFDRLFNERYIQGTFRHETFEPITYQQAEQLIRKFALPSEQPQLLNTLKKRSPQDAYYRLYYRQNDTNFGSRLRSWRPKGEVLMPLELRRQLAQEAAAEVKLYQDSLT